MRLSALSLLILCGIVCGCRAQQVAHDGKQFRQALLDMYVDQAMDNLIRARLNQPFVQLAYRDLLVQETDTYSAKATTGQSSKRTRTLAAVLTVAHEVTKSFSLEGMAQRQGQMSFKAEPVTNQNDIYEAYLAFAASPDLLCSSDDKPDCPVHMCRYHDGCYWWIPVEYGSLFMELVLQTSFMRGPETAPPAGYQTTIAQVLKVEEAVDDAINVYFRLSTAVPNGPATMVVKIDGRRIRLDLNAYHEAQFGEKSVPELGQLTTILWAQWSPKRRGFGPDELVGKTIMIYSHHYPPEAPTPLPQIQRLIDEVDRIRANQAIMQP